MKWFKHQADANLNAKLQEVILDHGMEGYGLYWFCIELVAMNVTSKKLTFELEHDGRIIARMTGMPVAKVDALMKTFIELDLFSASEGRIQCLKLAQRCDDFTSKAIRQNGLQSIDNKGDRESLTKSEKVPLEVRSKKLEVKKEIEDRFDEFWDLYGKKVDTKKCKAKFGKLKKSNVDKIFEALPKYIESTPDKQYRKLPLTWLNGECWNDEIQIAINSSGNSNIDYDLLVKNFNKSFSVKPNVPLAVKVTDEQRKKFNAIANEHGMTNERIESYFNFCAKSERFEYVTNGVNMTAVGISYFLKEETLLKAMN